MDKGRPTITIITTCWYYPSMWEAAWWGVSPPKENHSSNAHIGWGERPQCQYVEVTPLPPQPTKQTEIELSCSLSKLVLATRDRVITSTMTWGLRCRHKPWTLMRMLMMLKSWWQIMDLMCAYDLDLLERADKIAIDFRSSSVTSPASKAWSILANMLSAILVRNSVEEHFVVKASWTSQTCWTSTALPCLSFKYLHNATEFHSSAQSFYLGKDSAHSTKEQVSKLLLFHALYAHGLYVRWGLDGGSNVYSLPELSHRKFQFHIVQLVCPFPAIFVQYMASPICCHLTYRQDGRIL